MSLEKKLWPYEDQVYEIAAIILEFGWDSYGLETSLEDLQKSMELQIEMDKS